MKKNIFIILLLFLFLACHAMPILSNKESDLMLSDNVKIIEKGEAINYPLDENSIIECYAKRIDGSVDDFREYNDYFIVKNGMLYSTTMQKVYKPEKNKKLKKVDNVKLTENNKVLQLYDPLWEGSIRHHMRTVKINLETGNYYMKGTQDNWMWYRNMVASGYCRAIKPLN